MNDYEIAGSMTFCFRRPCVTSIHLSFCSYVSHPAILFSVRVLFLNVCAYCAVSQPVWVASNISCTSSPTRQRSSWAIAGILIASAPQTSFSCETFVHHHLL